MNPYHWAWGKHEKSLCWKPISTAPDRIKEGQPFLGRWKDSLEEWNSVICYYGQFGDCFLYVPMGYYAGAEKWVDEGEGINGSGFSIGEPDVHPEEWCDIPA